MLRRLLVLTFVLAGAVGLVSPAPAAVWSVSAVWQLQDALNGYAPGDEIVLATGTYQLTNNRGFTRGRVTLRSATGNRDDVHLVGGGMNTNSGCTEGLSVACDDVTIRDLTLQDFYYHGIHVRAENDADRYTITNVKILNCGERYIKGSAGSTYISENCLIENVWMEQEPGRVMANHNDNDYIGGIDIMATSNLVIRDCTAVGIKGATGGGRGGIFLWHSITNPTVERNVIRGCDRGIALGNPSDPGATWYVDGGIVRNNFIVRGAGIGLEICFTRNLDVFNNTMYGSSTYFRAVQVYGANTTGLELKYNILRGAILANGVAYTSVGNLTGGAAADSWFVDPAGGNLRLTEAATLAINHGASLPQVIADWDGLTRDAQPDIGADEFGLPPADANLDGLVDYNDLGALAVNYRMTTGATWAMGDFNFDDQVDYLDLGILASWYRFGTTGGEIPAGGESIPEPTSLLLLALGLPALLRRRGQPVAF